MQAKMNPSAAAMSAMSPTTFNGFFGFACWGGSVWVGEPS